MVPKLVQGIVDQSVLSTRIHRRVSALAGNICPKSCVTFDIYATPSCPIGCEIAVPRDWNVVSV